MIHVFVVNLPEATERRDAIDRQLKNLGLTYEIVAAVRGKSLSSEERERHCNARKFQRLLGRSIGAGELGCSLSHLEVYRRITSRGMPHALVLEDDAWLSPNVPALLDALERSLSPESPDLVLLSWANPIGRTSPTRLWSGYMLQRAFGGIGAHAYVISRAAAAELQKRLYPVRQTADCWAWLNRHRYVNLQAVTPPAACLDISYESNIAGEVLEQARSTGDRDRVRHLARRIRSVWWRLVDEIIALKDRAVGS